MGTPVKLQLDPCWSDIEGFSSQKLVKGKGRILQKVTCKAAKPWKSLTGEAGKWLRFFSIREASSAWKQGSIFWFQLLHPWKLTFCTWKGTIKRKNIIFQPSIFRGYLSFPGCYDFLLDLLQKNSIFCCCWLDGPLKSSSWWSVTLPETNIAPKTFGGPLSLNPPEGLFFLLGNPCYQRAVHTFLWPFPKLSLPQKIRPISDFCPKNQEIPFPKFTTSPLKRFPNRNPFSEAGSDLPFSHHFYSQSWRSWKRSWMERVKALPLVKTGTFLDRFWWTGKVRGLVFSRWRYLRKKWESSSSQNFWHCLLPPMSLFVGYLYESFPQKRYMLKELESHLQLANLASDQGITPVIWKKSSLVQVKHGVQLMKNPGCLGVYVGDEILPSYAGIIS